MPLSAEDLKDIDALFEAPGVEANTLKDLRARFPKFSLTRCDASDMGAEPVFKEYLNFDLYLVSSLNHCAALTTDPAVATGFVVVAKEKSI